MREPAKLVSDITMSKWSLELLGGISGLDQRLFVQSFKQIPGPDAFSTVTVQVPDRPWEFAFRGDLKMRWGVLLGFFLLFVIATTLIQRQKGSTQRRSRSRFHFLARQRRHVRYT